MRGNDRGGSGPSRRNRGPLGYDVDYPRLLVWSLTVVVLVGLVVAASTSAAAFGAYNARWDGASQLRSTAAGTGAEATILRNASRYAALNASGTVALVLSPDRPYGLPSSPVSGSSCGTAGRWWSPRT